VGRLVKGSFPGKKKEKEDDPRAKPPLNYLRMGQNIRELGKWERRE